MRASLRILYLSGYTQDVVLKEGVEHRGLHFVQKPYTGEALARKLRDILDSV